MTEPPAICHYVASDGYRLHYRHWKPDGLPRGYVVALHGIQSHSGWYEFSSGYLRNAGYEVRFLDRRGSGLNAEDRGHAAHADRLVNDVLQTLEEVRRERDRVAPFAPLILLGVSWGGKLAAVTAARRPELVEALALLYPGLRARVRPRWDQRWLLALGETWGAGRRLVRIPLDDPALFTGEAVWQEFIRNDPLALHEATVSFLRASVQLDADVDQLPAQCFPPTFVMLAGRDQIIDNHATRRLLERPAARGCTIHECPEAQHTLEFEPNREAIVSDLIRWLNGLPRR